MELSDPGSPQPHMGRTLIDAAPLTDDAKAGKGDEERLAASIDHRDVARPLRREIAAPNADAAE
jgi:hypothetical protein